MLRTYAPRIAVAAAFVAVCGMLLSGCAVEKKIVREVHQGLRNPDGDVMFLYSEERTNWHGEQPGLLKCDVDSNGNPVDCERFVISYELRQDYGGGGERAFYVYEDPEDPTPSNRGVVRCNSIKVKTYYRPADCRQRSLTDTFATGPGNKATFLYTPIRPQRGEKDVGFFGNLRLASGDASMGKPQSSGKKTKTFYHYGQPKGLMQCKVTDQGMLKHCEKKELVYRNDSKEG